MKRGAGSKDQGSGIRVGSEFRVQSSEPVGTSIARPPASPVPSLPLEGKEPPQGADEVELRQAIAIDEPYRASDPTSSVTASPCHLPLKGKAEDGGRLSTVPVEPPAPALAAIARLRAAGFPAYLVGGCVRDTLLGRVPGDWDITTAALPEQVEAVFAGERIIETGLKHGTVTVLLDGLPLEITTFRTEAAYSDHRHPDAVAFTPSLTEDLARRDFTINAMAWTRENTGDGLNAGLQDPFGGQADLEKKLIRCVGDPHKRFEEDALRILRALRFASQLDFTIDPATAAAAHALRDTLALVSRERIAVELTKLLCGPAARRIIVEYWEILSVPLPELAPMAGLDQRNKHHCYDVLEHSAAAVEAVPPEKLLRWAALLHDVAKPACFTVDEAGRGHFYGHAKRGAPMAREIMTRLRFDKDTVNRVAQLVELHDYPIDPPVEEGSGIGDQGSGAAAKAFPLRGRCPSSQTGADEVEFRQAIAIDEPHRATGPTSSVTAPPCHLPLKGKAEDGGRKTRILRCAQNDGVGAVSGCPAQADGLRRAEERAIRKLIGKLGQADFFRLLALKRADSLAHHPDYHGRTAACDRLAALARELLAQPPCFTVRDLAINGNDLLALGLPRGPEIGRTLNALLERVLAGELPNERERLLAAVKL